MNDNDIENIALKRATHVWKKHCSVFSITHEGNLPSVKVVVESDDGEYEGTIWVNANTGEIEQEDLPTE